MSFFNPETGEMQFSDGLCLRGGMPVDAIDPHLRYTGSQEAVYCLPPLAVEGGSLGAVLTADQGGLRTLRLTVAAITGRHQVPGERQRAFLFARLDLRDPCPDTMDCVRIECPFGEMYLSTDPCTGRAEARILYAG